MSPRPETVDSKAREFDVTADRFRGIGGWIIKLMGNKICRGMPVNSLVVDYEEDGTRCVHPANLAAGLNEINVLVPASSYIATAKIDESGKVTNFLWGRGFENTQLQIVSSFDGCIAKGAIIPLEWLKIEFNKTVEEVFSDGILSKLQLHNNDWQDLKANLEDGLANSGYILKK